ncbi:MAG: 30S ribosomal protein S17 [Patescibacteria group bacterium]
MTSTTTQPNPTLGRTLRGVVVSDKMTKTVVVEVTRLRKHDKYKKYYRVSRRFKAHDPMDEYHTGDTVIIKETRPLSKEKRWIVVERVSEAKTSPVTEE